MSYKALYRTYRPQDFNEVAGQEHITKTFQNALRLNKLSHAFLFAGPRGTGKTSIAKIIAKAVNCENAPTDNPCNKCANCIEITNNSISDVIEIDAASNNGVDEIREITDKVKFMPTRCKYKVYIIDEVHMLSVSAFNAILKTLEEPPEHVIFILATTEPHKVLSTIHSRCQRFDFRGISKSEIVDRMKIVLSTENINVDDESLNIIAEVAEGGMRDALSLLDQVITFAEGNIKVDDVNAVTGTVSSKEIIKITEYIIEKNGVEAVKIYENMLANGKETPRILSNMITFYRDLLMYKALGQNANDKSIFTDELFINLSSNISVNKIYEIINKLVDAQGLMKITTDKKIIMEVLLIKLTIDETVEKNEVVNNIVDDERVVKLESQLKEIITNIKLLINGEAQETKTYDVKIVERILNNALENGKEFSSKKKLLSENWHRIKNQNDVMLANTAEILEDFDVKAYSVNEETREIIITTNDIPMCNKIMELKEEVKEILKNTFKANYNFIALPNEVWNEKRSEFMIQHKKGIERPILSPIVYEGLVDRQEDEIEEESKIIKLAKKLFSSNLLEIK